MDIYSWNIGFLGYGNKWRRRRRLFHQFFNMNAVTNFDDYQRKYTYRFISRLSQTPEGFLGHAKLYVFAQRGSLVALAYLVITFAFQSVTGALIMDITYDLDIKSHEDKFLQAAERAMEWGEGAVLPGAFLVNTFPIRPFIS